MAVWPRTSSTLCAAVCVLVASCTFDGSTDARVDDGGITEPSDAGPRPQADAIAPEDCPSAIHIALRVGDATESQGTGEPYLHTLVGDTVELSAEGTCTRSGVIQYRWVIEPGTTQIESTALPNLTSETITVYSAVAEQFTVRLEVGDGTSTESVTVFGFESHGFEEVESYEGNRIRGLDAGQTFLWIGADDGTYRGSLVAPFSNFNSVNDLYEGETLPVKLQVLETAAGDRVWFGSDDGDGRAYALTLAAGEIQSYATVDSARTRDIAEGETGVRYATDRGVVYAPDSENFSLERNDNSDAVSYGGTGAWAGRDNLFPLPNGDEISLRGGDDRIRALEDDGTLLWIATGRDGVFTLSNDTIQTNYTAASDNLPSDDVRDLAIDDSGDIWIATDGGVSRYKVDRDVWIRYEGYEGLEDDLDNITVDTANGRRAVYVTRNDTLGVMRVP